MHADLFPFGLTEIINRRPAAAPFDQPPPIPRRIRACRILLLRVLISLELPNPAAHRHAQIDLVTGIFDLFGITPGLPGDQQKHVIDVLFHPCDLLIEDRPARCDLSAFAQPSTAAARFNASVLIHSGSRVIAR